MTAQKTTETAVRIEGIKLAQETSRLKQGRADEQMEQFVREWHLRVSKYDGDSVKLLKRVEEEEPSDLHMTNKQKTKMRKCREDRELRWKRWGSKGPASKREEDAASNANKIMSIDK